MVDKFETSLNATAENATTRPDPNNMNDQYYPMPAEIAKLMSIAAGIVIINSVVLYLFIKRKSLRTTSNYPLFSLALCDFLCGFLVIPLFTVNFFTPLVTSPRIKFHLGFLVTILHNFVAMTTVYHIVVVTGERYVAIKFPLKHRLLQPKCMIKFLAIVWFSSLLISMIPFTWIGKMYPVFQPEALNYTLAFTIFCMVFVLMLPYMFLVYAFTKMFKAISSSVANGCGQQKTALTRRHDSVTTSTGERKCLLLFVSMALLFLLCWLPWFVIFLLHHLPLDVSKLRVPSQVFLLVRYMTSALNPLLYTFLKRDFHRALKFVFKRKGSGQVSTSFNAYSTRRGTLLTDAYNKPPESPPNESDPSQLAFPHTQCFDSAL